MLFTSKLEIFALKMHFDGSNFTKESLNLFKLIVHSTIADIIIDIFLINFFNSIIVHLVSYFDPFLNLFLYLIVVINRLSFFYLLLIRLLFLSFRD